MAVRNLTEDEKKAIKEHAKNLPVDWKQQVRVLPSGHVEIRAVKQPSKGK